MKLISVNLQKMSKKELIDFINEYGFPLKDFTDNKEMGIVDMWILFNEDEYKVVAFTRKSDPSKINNTQHMLDFLNNTFAPYIPESSLPKAKISGKSTKNSKEFEVVLNIDAILDKINKYGLSSLSKEEKDFLKKQ
jgi:hypothetical protein